MHAGRFLIGSNDSGLLFQAKTSSLTSAFLSSCLAGGLQSDWK